MFRMKNKRVLKVFLFVAIFWLLQLAVGRLLRGDVKSNARIMMHELHTSQCINTIFVGASHVYRGVQPDKIDDALNTKSFVASSANQILEGSLAIIKEAKLYHPELNHVYVDIDYVMCFANDNDTRVRLKKIYNISKYLKNRKIKREYLLSVTPPKYYINNILEIGKEKVTVDPKKNFNTIKAYLDGSYWKYLYPVDKKNNETYMGRGYIAAERAYQDYVYAELSNPVFSKSDVSPEWEKTVLDIIEYCKDNDLKLTFISVPESNYFLLGTENHDDFTDYMRDLIGDAGCNYYDFNYTKDKYLHFDITDFYDDSHLNSSGSDKFNKVLTEVLKREGTGTEMEYFYESIAEKKSGMEENVYGFNILQSEDKKSFEIIPISNLKPDSKLTYDYYFTDRKGNVTVLFEDTEKSSIDYPLRAFGTLKANCYLNGELKCQFEQPVNTGWIK